MTAPSFTRSADAKAIGWFSRRHRTSEAHRAEQERYRMRMAEKVNRAETVRLAAEARKLLGRVPPKAA